MHALPELGQLRRPFAPEQVASELGFELLDCARQRRLCHVALVGRAREVEHARHRKKIPDLMHFHDQAPPDAAANLPGAGAEGP